MQTFDVIVIGTGGGTKIAIPAAKRGLEVALIEEDAFGGTCLNRGCIPSKMLIHPAEVAEQLCESARMGLRLEGRLQLDFEAVIARIIREVDGTSGNVRELHEAYPGITVFNGHATFTADKIIRVNGELLTADKIFIATGSRPAIPTIPGLEDTPYITSREALRLPTLPGKLLVIGAGYIALELGGAYSVYGAEVHFFVRSRFLRGLDQDISDEFGRVFERHHHVHHAFVAERVDHDGKQFHLRGTTLQGGSSIVSGDALLVAAGVVPMTDNLGLEHTGIEISEVGFIRVNSRLETTVPGVYALGDCIGIPLFRHTVNYAGEYLMRTAFSKAPVPPLDYGPVPYAVFTTPQIAGVGLTETQLRQLGVDMVVGKATYAESTPGMARVSDHGFAKVMFDRASRVLIGAHIIGEEAASMIHLFIAMMKKHGTLDDLLDMIFIHPALPEVARDAVRDAATHFDPH